MNKRGEAFSPARLRQALPSLKQAVIAVIVSLLLCGLIIGEVSPKVLLGLAFAAAYLGLVTMRNYDPDGYEAWHEPKAYSYRRQRDQLFQSLETLSQAVEADETLAVNNPISLHAAEARELLERLATRRAART